MGSSPAACSADPGPSIASDLRPDAGISHLPQRLLQPRLGLDHELDLGIEPLVFRVGQAKERLAHDRLEDLALGVGRLAGRLQRDLELGEVVDQLRGGEQLEPCRVSHPDLLPFFPLDRRVPEYHGGVLGQELRSAFASDFAIDANSL